jgi:hypothetical protein
MYLMRLLSHVTCQEMLDKRAHLEWLHTELDYDAMPTFSAYIAIILSIR